jgi:hypothetical protein
LGIANIVTSCSSKRSYIPVNNVSVVHSTVAKVKSLFGSSSAPDEEPLVETGRADYGSSMKSSHS